MRDGGAGARSLGLPRAVINELMDRLEQEEDRNEKRSGRSGVGWLRFRQVELGLRLEHPGGGVTTCRAPARSISRHGLRCLWIAYVHPGTHCEVELPTTESQIERFAGVVVQCRHVAGTVHDVELRFLGEACGSLDVRRYVSEQELVARLVAGKSDPSDLQGRLFYVDPDEHLIKLLAGLLKGTSVKVEGAARIEPAVEAVRSGKTDLVLCELDLADGARGEELITAVRGVPWGGPIVIVTGETDRDRLAAARETGANAIMRKPFDRAAVFGLVAHWLGGAAEVSAHRPIYSLLAADPNVQPLLAGFVRQVHEHMNAIRTDVTAGNTAEVRRRCKLLEDAAGCYGYREFAAAARDAVVAIDSLGSIEQARAQILRLDALSRQLKTDAPAAA